MSISASWSHAGAITSLKLGNEEFVDNADHGRQIQSAIQLNGIVPSYNPNEAGSIDDEAFPWSSSELLGLAIPSNNRLMTTTDMAYFFVKNSPRLTPQQQNDTVPPSNAPHDGQLTQFWLQKDVIIGPPGLPGNVIEYNNTFQPSVVTPPAPVTSSIASSAGVYLKYPDFSEAWTYDLATRTLLQNRDGNGSDDMIKIMIRPSSPLGPLALSAYAPEHLQPYGASAAKFGWWLVGPEPAYPCTFLDPNHYASGPLPVSYRTYLVVGNPGEVKSSLDALGLKFSSEDPDVFNWREYIRLNDLPQPQNWTEAQVRNHWLNTGLPEGYAASYRFTAGRYRDLNSDQWGKNYQQVIDHYIQYGRKEGRTSSPSVEGGSQHTVVRSPQQDFVFARASGANSYGQLGNGTTNRTASPVQLPDWGGNHRVTEVAAGDFTSLAVLANGTLWMWGSNANGARGNGSVGGNQLTPVQVPLPFPPGVSLVVPSTKGRHVVAAGQNAYAVIDTSGCVWTWGYGGNGQLGNGSQSSRYTLGKVQKSSGGDLTGIVSVSVGGANFMMALDIDGHVWTWGYNGYGALGNNSTNTRYTADRAQMQGGGLLAGISQIAAGGQFCFALDRSGRIWAWGYNAYGQLGDSTNITRTGAVVTTIPLYDHQIDRIAAGSYHGIAHSDYDGRIYAWGYNGYGALGIPPSSPVYTPVALPVSDATSNITDLAAGNFFSFLIRANKLERKIFATGDNQSGQLGLNHYMAQPTPALTGF